MANADDVEALASRILGVPSFAGICESLVERSLLPRGRVEASEFGRGEHSSATAGAVLSGFGGMPHLSDAVRQKLAAVAYGLVKDDGTVVAHDREATIGTTSWSLSQLLLGLAHHGNPEMRRDQRFVAAVAQLRRYQDPQTGLWALADGDLQDSLFSFYPSLLFVVLHRDKDWREQSAAALSASADGIVAVLGSDAAALVDRVLAAHLAARLTASGLPLAGRSKEIADLSGGVITSLVSESTLRLSSRTVHNDYQPRWHSTTWADVVYPCTRRWGGPLALHNVLITSRLAQAFDHSVRAWHGDGGSRGAGRAWASALAARAIYLAAQDLDAGGVSFDEWNEAVIEAQSGKTFDVVISFGGADRETAVRIRNVLVDSGLSVFYDEDYRHELLGEDLAIALQDIYFARSRYAVTVLSEAFLDSRWAGNWEWKAVLARMHQQKQSYVLPYFLEQVEVPGLNPTIGHVSADSHTPEEFAALVVKKLARA